MRGEGGRKRGREREGREGREPEEGGEEGREDVWGGGGKEMYDASFSSPLCMSFQSKNLSVLL